MQENQKAVLLADLPALLPSLLPLPEDNLVLYYFPNLNRMKNGG
jgi:hypothetical protein